MVFFNIRKKLLEQQLAFTKKRAKENTALLKIKAKIKKADKLGLSKSEINTLKKRKEKVIKSQENLKKLAKGFSKVAGNIARGIGQDIKKAHMRKSPTKKRKKKSSKRR